MNNVVNDKECKKCGLLKDICMFSRQSKARDGYHYWCKQCAKEHKIRKYNQDIIKSRLKTNYRRADRVKWFRNLKKNIPCCDCGKIYEPFCMDYDHIPGIQKINNVSTMVLRNNTKQAILDEIKKCELVCLFCHNKRTYDRFNNILGEKRKYTSYQQRNINIINYFKNKPCAICNNQYEKYNMQIDHIDSSTKFRYVCNLKSFKESILREELLKCQVLCAMCHRRKSSDEGKLNKYLSH